MGKFQPAYSCVLCGGDLSASIRFAERGQSAGLDERVVVLVVDLIAEERATAGDLANEERARPESRLVSLFSQFRQLVP